MGHEKFESIAFRPESLERIEHCNDIILRYMRQGLRLTLRQLYYQLVTVNAVQNNERSYQNLSRLVSDARLAGRMDWDAIEDRVRQPYEPTEFKDLAELVDAAIGSYRLPRWRGQENYVELWVEKDALSGVLQPIAREYHIVLMVNRGYSSQSAMYESAQRIMAGANQVESARWNEEREEQDLDAHVFYLGDFDPSGEDMVRDIGNRLVKFGVQKLNVQKVALTSAQVKKYKPPPNPAKESDSRSAAFIAAHGAHSYEVDALPPQELVKIIRNHLDRVVDRTLMAAVEHQEERDKRELEAAVAQIMAKRE